MKKYQKLEIGNESAGFEISCILCPLTYDLSIVVKCEKNVFKSPQICEQIVKFRDNSYKF